MWKFLIAKSVAKLLRNNIFVSHVKFNLTGRVAVFPIINWITDRSIILGRRHWASDWLLTCCSDASLAATWRPARDATRHTASIIVRRLQPFCTSIQCADVIVFVIDTTTTTTWSTRWPLLTTYKHYIGRARKRYSVHFQYTQSSVLQWFLVARYTRFDGVVVRASDLWSTQPPIPPG